jgi:hypothetical protein
MFKTGEKRYCNNLKKPSIVLFFQKMLENTEGVQRFATIVKVKRF